MVDVTQGLRLGGPSEGERVAVAGHVSTSRPAPTSFTSPLYVVLPDFSPDYTLQCDWAALHGSTLPAQGAAALVVFDGANQPYAVWWDAPGPTKPTVTGSKGGNAALTSLVSALASLGLITDSTT